MVLEAAAMFGTGGKSPLVWWNGIEPAEQAMLLVFVREKRRESAGALVPNP